MAMKKENIPDQISESDQIHEMDVFKEESLDDIRKDLEMHEEERKVKKLKENKPINAVVPSKRKCSDANMGNRTDGTNIRVQVEDHTHVQHEEIAARPKIRRRSVETNSVPSASHMADSNFLQVNHSRPQTPFGENRDDSQISRRMELALNHIQSYMQGQSRESSTASPHADLCEFNARHYNIPWLEAPHQEYCDMHRANVYVPPQTMTPNEYYPIRPIPTHRYLDWYHSAEEQLTPIHLGATNTVVFREEHYEQFNPTFLQSSTPIPEEDFYFADDEHLPHGY